MNSQLLESKIKAMKCPKCKLQGRLLMGPAYDRGRVRCLNCGVILKIRKKEEKGESS